MPCSCNQVRAPPQSPVSLSRSSQLGCGAGTVGVRRVSPAMVMAGAASSGPANALYPAANVIAATASKTSVTLDFMLRVVLTRQLCGPTPTGERTAFVIFRIKTDCKEKAYPKSAVNGLALTGSFRHICGIDEARYIRHVLPRQRSGNARFRHSRRRLPCLSA